MTITTGSKIEISLVQTTGNSDFMNVFQYTVAELGAVFDATQQAEAWWNHVKTDYRAIAPAGWGTLFKSVLIKELDNPTGDMAEFAVPSGEAEGTRAGMGSVQNAADFMALGVRLTVASRTTRPGQKRLGFLTESDLDGNRVGTAYMALADTLMSTLTNPLVLGSPAVGTVLTPIVVRRALDGSIAASQPVISFIINPFITSQRSRRVGHGI